MTTIADLIKVLNRALSQEMDFEDNTLRGEKPMVIQNLLFCDFTDFEDEFPEKLFSIFNLDDRFPYGQECYSQVKS